MDNPQAIDKAAPTLFAGMVTGIFASIIFITATVIDSAILTPSSALSLIFVMLIAGLIIGISFLWPLSYICSVAGLTLAASQPWARKPGGWVLAGAGIGGLLLSALVLAQSEVLPLLFFSPYGAVCGALAGILCHHWIGVENLFAIDAQQ